MDLEDCCTQAIEAPAGDDENVVAEREPTLHTAESHEEADGAPLNERKKGASR
jgi:hypothetical protein